MRIPDTKVIVFNAAAVLISAAAVVGVVRALILTPTSTPCSERYTNSTSFSLERGRAILTAADLQSSLSGRDGGVMDSLSIGKVSKGPAPVAMTVSMAKGTNGPSASGPPKAGVSFPWHPRVLQGKTAVCLSYDVLLPGDFQFNRGGMLPGLSGAEAGVSSPEDFNARMVWREGGQAGATLRVTNGGETRAAAVERETFTLPRGRWVKLEQEVVLNTPRLTDGVMRAWIDGSMVIERTDLSYRTRPGLTISGVAVEVFYSTADGSGPAPTDTKLSLTPFEVRWQ